MTIINQQTSFIQEEFFIQQLKKFVDTSISYPKDKVLALLNQVKQHIDQIEWPELITQFLKDLDEQFYLSEYRIQNYSVKDRVPRSLTTIDGTYHFKRRIYIHKTTGDRFKYIDEVLGIRRYQRIEDSLLFQMMQEYIQDKSSYQKVASKYDASKTVLYNGFKNLDEASLTHFETLQTSDTSTLYIQADEHYVSTQHHNPKDKIMVKQVTLFEGISQVCKRKTKLDGRIILTQQYRESNPEFHERVDYYIQQRYTNIDNIKPILRGDGAPWIQTLAQALDVPFYIDNFHFIKAVKSLCPKGLKYVSESLLNCLEEERYQDFDKTLMVILQIDSLKQLSEPRQQAYHYVRRFEKSYFQAKHKGVLGCSAEGMVSHYLADLLTRRPKAFNPRTAHILATLTSIYHNGSNLREGLSQHKTILYKPCQKAPLSAADFNGENKSQSKEYTLKTTRRTALERELIRNDPFNYH